MKHLLSIALAILCAAPLAAQNLEDRDLVCPVGGQEFTFAMDPYCTPLGSMRRMSFGPDSPCDHVPRIPICPDNELPLFRPLSTEDVATLETLIVSPDYVDIRAKPPFLRAYAISDILKETDPAIRHGLLIEAWWWETETFLSDPRNVDALVTETEAVLTQTPDSEAPFVQAMLAYVLKLSGRDPLADLWLGRANTWTEQDPFLVWYLDLLKGCWDRLDEAECQPGYSIQYFPE